MFAVKLKDPTGRFFERGYDRIAILVVDPGLERNALDQTLMVRGELGDADRVEPRGDRDRFLPVREPPAIAEVALLLQQPIRDNLIKRGRRDDELAGRLVVGVVDHRQPLMSFVGPVLAGEGSLAMSVLADPKSGARDAVIRHRKRLPLAGFGRRVESHAEPVVLVLVPDRGTLGGYAGNHHPLARFGGTKVECESRHPLLDEPQVDGCLAGDLVAVVTEGQAERVVDRINARLAWVGIGDNGNSGQ